jgi:hypothetical protein
MTVTDLEQLAVVLRTAAIATAEDHPFLAATLREYRRKAQLEADERRPPKAEPCHECAKAVA